MKHGFSLTSPLYHVIITNRVNKAFMKGYTTAGVFLCVAFFSLKGERLMVHINGKDENAAGMTIQKYLDENDYIVTHIAVECNEKIVDKSDYSSYVLKDNDIVEIVSFVGGGSVKKS